MQSLADDLCSFSSARRALPLLYIEFSHGTRAIGARVQPLKAADKQVIAAALKASVGSILRKDDLVAAGAGGVWFIALLTTIRPTGPLPLALDPDIGIAAERLRRTTQTALAAAARGEGAGRAQRSPITVRCGWTVLEPVDPKHPLEALRHAVRGAAVVARVEERRATVLAAVTHELRTPLTSIIGFAQRLQEEDTLTSGQRKRALVVITDEARRLHRLVEGLIDVGSWSAGGLRLSRDRHDLADITRQAASAVRDRAERKGVSINISGRAAALVDRDRVLQVIINLLDNALRYSPAGGRINARSASQKRAVTLTITDQGPGFAAAVRARAGRPFASGANGQVGLGLAIARILIEAHGGTLALGRPGRRGGHVSVSLPTAEADR